MKITMKETKRGSEDGHSVRLFEAYKTYDVRDGLARSFFAADVAYPAHNPPQDPLELAAKAVSDARLALDVATYHLMYLKREAEGIAA